MEYRKLVYEEMLKNGKVFLLKKKKKNDIGGENVA